MERFQSLKSLSVFCKKHLRSEGDAEQVLSEVVPLFKPLFDQFDSEFGVELDLEHNESKVAYAAQYAFAEPVEPHECEKLLKSKHFSTGGIFYFAAVFDSLGKLMNDGGLNDFIN